MVYMRFVMRQILRSPFKLILTVAVAATFVFFMGFLRLSIDSMEQEVDWLRDNTFVNVEFQYVPWFGDTVGHSGRPLGDVIPISFIDDVYDMGFIHEAYLESGHSNAFVTPLANIEYVVNTFLPELYGMPFFNHAEFFPRYNPLLGIEDLRHFTQDPEGFLSRTTHGMFADDDNMHIEFAPGFGYDDFAYADESLGLPIPAIIPRSLVAQWEEFEWEFNLGQTAQITYIDPFRPREWHSVEVIIIGVHDGNALANESRGATILPDSALRLMLGRSLGYRVFRFTLNPALNEDIDNAVQRLHVFLSEYQERILGGQFNMRLLRLDVADQELSMVVQSAEQTLQLLSMLYPIAIAVSAVIGLGLAAIIIMQNAKNIAIMCALGVKRLHTMLAIIAEYMLVCIFGIVLGLCAIMLVDGAILLNTFNSALPYFGGAVLGAVAGAIYATGRPPLDLLQVKE